jgi:hypothetical protein
MRLAQRVDRALRVAESLADRQKQPIYFEFAAEEEYLKALRDGRLPPCCKVYIDFPVEEV